MRFSTSSSDLAAEPRSFDELRAHARRVSLRTAIAGLAILAAGLAFARCQISWIDPLQPEKKRLREALEALPAIAAQRTSTAMVFGSSLVWNGFSPRVFDATLRQRGVELETFNFGFGGLNPEVQLVLARRIRAAFEQEHNRLAITLVEFNPFQTTVVRAETDDDVREQHLMMLATPEQTARLVLKAPGRAARFFASHWFRKSLSPEAVTAVFGGVVQQIGQALETPDAASAPTPAEREQIGRRAAASLDFIRGLVRAHRGIPKLWQLSLRGDAGLDLPESHEALLVMQHPTDYELRRDLEMRIRCCDIERLRFDEGLVRDFIALVAELGAVSDRVEVVLFPVNRAWVRRTPEGEKRLREVLSRIEAETGVPVRDFQIVPGVGASHFWDSTHLTFDEGAPLFSRVLADDYAPRLVTSRHAGE